MELRDILTLTVEELRANISELGLDATGTKTDLQERLIKYFSCLSDAGRSPELDKAAITVERETFAYSNFTLRDIGDSVNRFSGENTHDVEKWIQEFEDCALVLKWNNLQYYVYAKQLLTGAAKTFIRSQSGVRDWNALKTILRKEFGARPSAASIHKKLKARRKQNYETLKQYLYSIMEIGSPINLDQASIIEYFIEGVPGSMTSKTILYQARNLEELKEKIDIFERITSTEKSSNFRNERLKGNTPDPRVESRKCYKCGEEGHVARDCKPIRCFKCNKIGHKSYECISHKRDSAGANTAPNVHTLTEEAHSTPRRIFKDITVLNKDISAIIDTGSDINILRYDTLLTLTDAALEPEKRTLHGIGGKNITTLGCLKARAKLDTVELDMIFHIVRESDIVYAAVIGNDIFNRVDLVIDSNGARFRNKIRAVSIFERTTGENSENESLDETFLFVDEGNTDLRPALEAKLIAELENEFGAIVQAVTPNSDEIELELEHLNETYQSKIKSAVENFHPQKPTKCAVEMKIVLSDDIPVTSRPRRTSYADQQVIENQVKEWLKEGVIKPSFSEYSSPVVLVSKKDGSKRLCCDYRRLNEKIIRDNFPMAVIDDVIQRLQEAKVFTTLDLKNGFLHVPVAKDSQKYTAFVTANGQYEFQFVPFGISNSPAVFCRYISAVFHDLVRDGTIVIYMDDIVILSRNEEEGIHNLRRVLKVASLNGLRFKWRKCQFLRRKIKFLGYVIENSSISPSEGKIAAIKKFPIPNNLKAVQRFLGLTSFFRRFIPDYARVAKPLSDLLKKNSKFKMGDEELLAIQQLKIALSSNSVLRLYNPRAETEIHTDASKYGYGAVLLQRDSEDKAFHPVEYMSRKTTSSEEKYHSYELEVLAIVEALKKWRVYVLGLKFKIITDCNAFTMTMRKEDVPVRISRWALFLQEFDYTIEHRSGTRMKHVDALSRASCLMIQESLQHRLKEAQQKDNWTKAVCKVLEKSSYEDYFLKYGILHKDPAKELIVIPSGMEKEIIEMAHRQGHFAVRKTKDLVEKQFYIPNLEEKTETVIKNCVECIIVEAKKSRKEGMLNPIDKSDRPFVTFHIDHVGPMEATHKMYNHILVIIDAFTKFVWLYPTKSTSSNEVVEKLRKQSAVFGNPQRIITDRGTAFTANEFEEYCVSEGIQHLLIATGVPRGNGQVERINRVIVPMLAKMCVEKPNSWYKYVDQVQQIINNSSTRSTQYTPFQLMTGVSMRTKECHHFSHMLQEFSIADLQQERNKIRDEARENIAKIQKENKKTFDKKRIQAPEYKIGDLVAIKRTQYGTGMKLRPKFLGPYKVVKKQNHDRYEVVKVGEGEGSRSCSTVVEYMKPWNPASGRSRHQDGRM